MTFAISHKKKCAHEQNFLCCDTTKHRREFIADVSFIHSFKHEEEEQVEDVVRVEKRHIRPHNACSPQSISSKKASIESTLVPPAFCASSGVM
jgi:hypothetical protein